MRRRSLVYDKNNPSKGKTAPELAVSRTGIRTVAVCTGKANMQLESVLQHVQVAEHFDKLGSNDISDEENSYAQV